MASVNPQQLFSQTFEKSTLFTVAAAAVSPLNAESSVSIFIHEATSTGDDYLTDPVLGAQSRTRCFFIYFFSTANRCRFSIRRCICLRNERLCGDNFLACNLSLNRGVNCDFYHCQMEGCKNQYVEAPLIPFSLH